MAIDSIDVYQYHWPQNIHQKIPPTTLVLKYVCNFSYSMISIILSQIYFICWSSPMFVGVFFLIDCLKLKSNPIYFKQTKIIQDVMSILIQKNQMQKCNICDYNLGGV
jgi:uncharacterized membrane protein